MSFALDPRTGDDPPELDPELLRRLAARGRWSRVRETERVRAILAATTREDLSWRGELRLVRDFLRERLRTSRAWRVLAASVAFHLFALPSLALWRWTARDAGFLLRIEPSTEADLPQAFEPEELVLDVPETLPLDPDADGFPVDAHESWNARRLDRLRIEKLRLPAAARALASAPAPGPGRAPEIALLDARTLGLTRRTWPNWILARRPDVSVAQDAADVPHAPGQAGDLRASRAALLVSLWVEVLLDRQLFSEGVPPELRRLLYELERIDARDPSALGEHALRRARAYGLLPAERGFDPLAGPGPIDPAWVEVLGASLRGAGGLGESAAHPLLGAWPDSSGSQRSD